MTTEIDVQFSDSLETVIISVFASEQSSDAYNNLGTVQSDDARYVTFYSLFPEDSGLVKPGD